jgi:hypothetical protein
MTGGEGKHLQIHIFDEKKFRFGAGPDRDREYIILHPPLSGELNTPGQGAPHHIPYFFPAHTFFRGTINAPSPAFDLDEMKDVPLTGDDIHFIPAVSPVAVQDLILFPDEPFGCPILTSFPQINMPWHCAAFSFILLLERSRKRR